MLWEYGYRRDETEKEKRFWENLGRKLGTTWYKSDFAEGTSAALPDPNRVDYPLAVLISPNGIYKMIKKDFERHGLIAGGDYRAERGEEIIATGNMSYDEFREWAKEFGLIQ